MNQSVTVNFVPAQVVTWVIVGLLAGLLASLIVRGRGLGFVASVVVGLLGALVGGFLVTALNIQLPAFLAGGLTLAWADIFVASIGAILILVLFGGFYRRRNYNRE